jgi:Tfp pilus assembly protein PilV
MADERTHSACRWSRLRAVHRGEAGFALIEVVVSAGLVMVIAAAVLGGVDVPSVISGQNQVGSQAAALAQQDQERMRAMPIAQLINYSATNNKTVDKRTYTVRSLVTWVTDSGSTVTCASTDTTSGDYLRLRTTVDGPGQKRPVVIESLLAPPQGSLASSKGNLAVLVTNQVGDPVAGIPVSIPGKSGVTDANGCVFFGLVDPGQYQVTTSKPGYVDPAGNETAVQSATVSVNNTTLVQQSYAVAATITANVTANEYGVVGPSPARTVTLSNANMPPAGTKAFTAANQTATSLVAQRLYPFTDGYTGYAGSCPSNNPVPNFGPFAVTPAPGASATMTVRQAALNITVTGLPSGTQSVRVTLDNTTAGCPNFADILLNGSGRLTEPGFPAGTYDVCIEGQLSNSWYRVLRPGTVLTNQNGTTMNIDAMGANPQAGTCPNPTP